MPWSAVYMFVIVFSNVTDISFFFLLFFFFVCVLLLCCCLCLFVVVVVVCFCFFFLPKWNLIGVFFSFLFFFSFFFSFFSFLSFFFRVCCWVWPSFVVYNEIRVLFAVHSGVWVLFVFQKGFHPGVTVLFDWIIIIIMYIYHALINALSAHMIHINLNMIFYTHVKHSPTKTIYIKYYLIIIIK